MIATKAISFCTAVSLLILILSYFYNSQSAEESLKARLRDVLEAMLEVEKQHSIGELRVAIGYGACRDLFVQSSEFFGPLEPPKKRVHHSVISNLQELKETFAFFFSAGSAAERYVDNHTLFNEMVVVAEKMNDSYYALGGNAPIMAMRFAKEGVHVLLAARRDKSLLQTILPNIEVYGSPSEEGREVHLILEYTTGESWGRHIAPRANRFIIHSDIHNPQISAAFGFKEKLLAYHPHLFVVGGLQMMDNFPLTEAERNSRLIEVKSQMVSQPPSTKIHFEMASFTDHTLLDGLVEHIVPFCDSMGMNEQELPNLFNLLKYGNISIVSDYNPRVAVVLDQMREVFSILNNKTLLHNGERQLTRLHVHTLAFQAILVDKSASWKNCEAAATKASLTANRHVCGNDNITIENAMLLMDDAFTLSNNGKSERVFFNDKSPVSCWDEEGGKLQICVAPVLVCTSVQITAGGGDNISAAGLVLQL